MLRRSLEGLTERLCRPTLPDGHERDFLQALLLPQPGADAAWRRWLTRSDIPKGGLDLLPMLGARLMDLDPAPAEPLWTRLSAAVVVEQRRGVLMGEILDAFRSLLADETSKPLLFDGPLPATAPAPLALRHSGRLAFLVPKVDASRMADRLVEAGFAVRHPAASTPRRHALRHVSGLPIQFYAGSLPPPLDAFDYARLSERVTPDGDVCEADRLALALAEGVRTGMREGELRWFADAALLLRSKEADPSRLRQWLAIQPAGYLLSGALAVLARTLPGFDVPAAKPTPPWTALSAAIGLRGRRAVLAALVRP